MLITDNGCQFSSTWFVKFHQELGITYYFTSVDYSQTNEEAKVTNQTLL